MSLKDREANREFYEPSIDELKARNRRNIAIGLGLAAFCVLAFFIMVSRSGAFADPKARMEKQKMMEAEKAQMEQVK